jgi:hypothetical protein
MSKKNLHVCEKKRKCKTFGDTFFCSQRPVRAGGDCGKQMVSGTRTATQVNLQKLYFPHCLLVAPVWLTLLEVFIYLAQYYT